MVSPYFAVGWGFPCRGGSQTLPPPDCQTRAIVAIDGIYAILLCGPFMNDPSNDSSHTLRAGLRPAPTLGLPRVNTM